MWSDDYKSAYYNSESSEIVISTPPQKLFYYGLASTAVSGSTYIPFPTTFTSIPAVTCISYGNLVRIAVVNYIETYAFAVTMYDTTGAFVGGDDVLVSWIAVGNL